MLLRANHLILMLILLAGHAPAVRAQLPASRLDAVFPLGAQAGQTTQLAVTGENLDGAERLVFSHPGITGEVVRSEADRFYPQGQAVEGQFQVAIAPDVPAGIYEVRAVSPFGISNARRFAVGDKPHIVEIEPNDSIGDAQPLDVESSVHGRSDSRNYDFYRFTAPAGGKLSIVCTSRRMLTSANAVMTLLDDAGRELTRSETLRGGDAGIEWTAPAEGAYFIRVHDLLYDGGESYAYQLRVSAATSDNQLAQAQSTALDALRRPAEAVGLGRNLQDPDHAIEQEPNNDPSTAMKLDLQRPVRGRFDGPGDLDVFAFEAAKGATLAIEVLSDRFGFATDPFLVVQQVEADGSSKDLAQIDDPGLIDPNKNSLLYRYPIMHADPVHIFIAPQDGEYRLILRDLFNSSAGSGEKGYLLVARPPKPDFQLVAFPYQSILYQPKPDTDMIPMASAVRPGGSTLIHVMVLRQEAYGGPVQLRIDGLPEGVTAEPVTVPPLRSHGTLVIAAAADAQPWAGPVRIVGKGADGAGQPIEREAYSAEVLDDVKANVPVTSWLTATHALAVTSDYTAPLRIEVGDGKPVALQPGGKVEVPVKLVTTGPFKGELTLNVNDQHPSVKAAAVKLSEAAPQATLVLEADANAPAGEWSCFLHGIVAAPYTRNAPAVEAVAADVQRIEAIHGESAQVLATAGAARQQAEKNAAVTTLTEQQAAEAKASLAAATEAEAKAKSAADEAEKALAEARKRLEEATKSAAARDVQITVTSPPIVVQVAAPN